MSKFFMYGSELQELEQLMMLVPKFLPRKSGVIILNRYEMKRKSKVFGLCNCMHEKNMEERKRMNHLQLVGEIFQNVGNDKLDKRIIKLRENFAGEVFETNEHVHNFYKECAKRKISFANCNEKFVAVIFIFASTDERLERYYKCIVDQKIDFGRADLTSIHISDYAAYQAARTIYTERTHIYVDELADESLIEDKTFVLIVNSFLIAKHGTEVLRMAL